MRACRFWSKCSTPIKLCHMTAHKVGMITYVQIFWGLHPRNLRGPKNPKFGPSSTFDFDCEYLRNKSRHQKSETNLIDVDPCWCWVQQKNVLNLSPLRKKLQTQMLTHPKSTMHVLRMLMHCSSGRVTLLWGKFQPPKFSPQSDLRRWVDSRWALPQISSF